MRNWGPERGPDLPQVARRARRSLAEAGAQAPSCTPAFQQVLADLGRDGHEAFGAQAGSMLGFGQRNAL